MLCPDVADISYLRPEFNIITCQRLALDEPFLDQRGCSYTDEGHWFM